MILREAQPLVIPEGVIRSLGRAGNILHPGLQQCGQRPAFLRGYIHAYVVPKIINIPDVSIARSYIPIPRQQQRIVRFLAQPRAHRGPQCLEELQLVVEMRIPVSPPIGNIQAPHRDRVRPGTQARSQGTRLHGGRAEEGAVVVDLRKTGLPGEAHLHVRDPHAGKNRDSVPLVEAGAGDLIPGGFKNFARELRGRAFRFL